jgi:hypothetical protein
MKENRIKRILSKSRKQGYYKVKAKQMKLKAIYEATLKEMEME